MIGKVYISVFPFYDIKLKKQSFKKRPILIIGQADIDDYVVLPISRVTNKSHLDSYYDVEILPSNVPLLNLSQTSYIRTHKQAILNIRELTRELIDFRLEYENIYLDVLTKVEEFQKKLIENAI